MCIRDSVLKDTSEDEDKGEVKVNSYGDYISFKLYGFYMLFPRSLQIAVWAGFHKLILNGDGTHEIFFDNTYWAPGEWSRAFWWLPVTPFALTPRNANGEYWFFGEGHDWHVVCDATKQLKAYEIDADLVTHTGMVCVTKSASIS